MHKLGKDENLPYKHSSVACATISAERLPLSWHLTTPAFGRIPETMAVQSEAPQVQVPTPLLALPLSCKIWLPWLDTPDLLSPADWFRYCRAAYRRPVLLRGCSQTFADTWVKMGGGAIATGEEALLPLGPEGLQSASLRALVRRGNRWGKVYELAYAELEQAHNQAAFSQLWQNSRQGAKPTLRGMYRTQPGQAARCFVFIRNPKSPPNASPATIARVPPYPNWLACITLTRCHPRAWHTELILRHASAPVGVLEASIVAVFEQLLAEGYTGALSLGEVPFTGQAGGTLSRWVRSIGQQLGFAYNADGLWQFKDKFSPQWHPLFACSTTPMDARAMADLFFQSGVHKLIWKSLLARH